MADVTQILSKIEDGDPSAAEQLLPVVYEELRKLAAARLAYEKPGQTLQATALVHDAYLRLVDGGQDRHWNGRRHFFGAAAEAMRRILVEQARRKSTQRHGGRWKAGGMLDELPAIQQDTTQTLAVDELLDGLVERDPRTAQVAKMRVFLQMTFVEIAEVLDISADSAESNWAFARAWLKRQWLRQ